MKMENDNVSLVDLETGETFNEKLLAKTIKSKRFQNNLE